MDLNLSYLETPPTIQRFFDSKAFIRGIRGPIGSGKSTASCFDIMRIGCEQKPFRVGDYTASEWVAATKHIVVRNTYPELKTTTIRTWHTLIPPTLGHWVDQGPPRHMLKFKHDYGHTIECEVIFLALDSPLADVQKVLSLDATTFWFNEAREIPKAIVDAATGRVGRYPSMAQGGCTYAGILMDTNSPDSDHWWYTLAERDTSTTLGRQMLDSMAEAELELRQMGALGPDQPLFEFFAQPGGRHPLAENLPNLRKGYYQFAMAGKSPDWIKVYVDGEYGFVQDGKPVHPDYVDSVHCKPCKYEPRRPLVIGMDFGLTPAAAYLQTTYAGQWRCIGELCANDMGISRFGQTLHRDIQQRFPDADLVVWGDPAGDSRDSDEHTAFELLKAQKITAKAAPSQDPSIRREALGGPLRRMIDGQPGFIVDPSAVMIRKGLAGKFRYRRMQVAGDARYEDRPDKNDYSHPCEALEYGLLGGGENRVALGRPRIVNAPAYAKGVGE